MVLFIGIVIFVLVIAVIIFTVISLKRRKNAKLCEKGYYCVLIGPDRVWMKVLPAKDGMIVQPTTEADKKKFYKKGEPEIPWSQEGYIVPDKGPIPTVMYPIEASSQTQVSVGMLIYTVGSCVPLGYDKDGKFIGYGIGSGQSPVVVKTLFKNRDTEKLFSDAATESTGEIQAKSKSNVLSIITIIGIIAILIVSIVILLKVFNIPANLSLIKGALGY